MFKLNNNSIIYVGCPAFFKTGGTELAHQLVFELVNLGADARILYYDYHNGEESINPAFLKYVETFETLENVIDSNDNVIIQPEVFPQLLDSFQNMQKAVWWMSVDNFQRTDGFFNCVKTFGFDNALELYKSGKIPLREYMFSNDTIHFYQSEYARMYLISKGIDENHIYPLSDYINSSFFEQDHNSAKEDIVLYNPKKGLEFTEKLISKSNGFLNWFPIENMSTEDVAYLLSRSKVYVDFGNHPGKDRFPREACVSGCCIITGKRGSANNDVDLPISEEYKFEDKDDNIDAIIHKIAICLRDYDKECVKFENYRNTIKKEYDKFVTEVKCLIK